jgi:hypothetical protein
MKFLPSQKSRDELSEYFCHLLFESREDLNIDRIIKLTLKEKSIEIVYRTKEKVTRRVGVSLRVSEKSKLS